MRKNRCTIDDAAALVTVFPLQFAQLEPGENLLVAGCSYTFDPKQPDAELGVVIARDSVNFSLFKALG